MVTDRVDDLDEVVLQLVNRGEHPCHLTQQRLVRVRALCGLGVRHVHSSDVGCGLSMNLRHLRRWGRERGPLPVRAHPERER